MAACIAHYPAAGPSLDCACAGAGIVANSNPASEQAECVNKAKALFRAAEEARRFASVGRRGQ